MLEHLCKISYSSGEPPPNDLHIAFLFALLMIVRCGFGLDIDWTTPPKSPNGDMTVQQALRMSLDAYKMAIFTPKWIQNLPLRRCVAFYPKPRLRPVDDVW